MNKRIAFYHMQHNSYLGNCICLVYSPTKEEIASDALQSPHVLILIKSKLDLSPINTLEDFKSKDIFSSDSPIVLRISSECLLGVFGDSHCDCESQRTASLREISLVGQGIFIHLSQEGQGNGLIYKVKELELQVNGIDPLGLFIGEKSVHDAAKHLLGSADFLDKRNYNSLSRIFQELLLNRYSYDLMSDNPQKINYLKKVADIKINSLRGIKRTITIENAGEYLAKLYMKNFEMNDQELQSIYYALFSAKELPNRVISLLKYIQEDLAYGKQFRANNELLSKIANLHQAKQGPHNFQDLALFKDSTSYTEYQTEVVISAKEVDLLFKNNIFSNDESVAYEENYFYDLVYLKGVPARSLKIRKNFRLINRDHPTSLKLIYKIPLSENNYIIKSITIANEDLANLIGLALRDYEIHFLPVFTHNIATSNNDITILLKRYSNELRTLSLMGEKEKVEGFIKNLRQYVQAEEIDDPTNHRYIRRDLSLGFQYEELVDEELEIFKKYHKG